MASQIRAGSVGEINKDSGDWMIVDLGFSAKRPSCGIWTKADGADVVEFGVLVKRVIAEAQKADSVPLNLLLEAPLSVAFKRNGNPTRRLCDTRDSKHRDWYVNAGATTLIAADHLLRNLNGCQIHREVRLFEGFVSFKDPKNEAARSAKRVNPHERDVLLLKNAVWNPNMACIFTPGELQQKEGDTVQSAFAFLCKDLVPPVIRIDPPTMKLPCNPN